MVGGNHETSQRAVDAIMKAFAHAVPERLTAGGSTTAGLLIFGGTRRDGATGTFYETHGGGEGARADRDGVPVVRVHLTNTMNTPAEIVEAEYMIRVDEQRLRPGSGGAGRHRGGEGMVRTYTVLGDGLTLTTMFERRVVPPYGLMGGEAGAPFRVTLHRAAGGSRELSGKENLTLADGRSRGHGDVGRRRLRHGHESRSDRDCHLRSDSKHDLKRARWKVPRCARDDERARMSQRLARATAAFSSRLAPGTERASSIASLTLWLMPSKQGVKIIAVGAMVATA